MLYIGYFIILDGENIKKKTVSEISIFQLPRLGLGCPPPKNTQMG